MEAHRRHALRPISGRRMIESVYSHLNQDDAYEAMLRMLGSPSD